MMYFLFIPNTVKSLNDDPIVLFAHDKRRQSGQILVGTLTTIDTKVIKTIGNVF